MCETQNTELDKIITQSGKTKVYLAKKCGLTPQGFNNKLRHKTKFKADEVKILCDELNITNIKTLNDIFFN